MQADCTTLRALDHTSSFSTHARRSGALRMLTLASVLLLPACSGPSGVAAAGAPAPDAALAASAQCTGVLPDFGNSTPPPDYGGTLPASQTQLATFAWQHFVALNWASSYASNGKRGTPDGSTTFFGQPGSAQPQMTVWQSYRHKNELFPNDVAPATGVPNKSFDTAPAYVYGNVTGACTSGDTNPNVFTNLDENSQLGLDYMFAQPPGASDKIQILFQAKVNRANYDYIVTNQLFTTQNQSKYQVLNKGNLATYGAICQQSQPQNCAQVVSSSPTAGYCLPCGGAGSEGTIHVKAAWRVLTDAEAKSGRFFVAPVVFYQPRTGTNVCYSNGAGQTWGLVGLHIIHKTVDFPAYVFATWEQVDNPASNLKFVNTEYGGPAATVGQVQDWQRVANQGSTLPSADVQTVNGCVQAAIKQANASSVWQYYQLVGVQGTPVDYANAASDLPDFFLANNTIESNAFFQSFVGNKAAYYAPGSTTGPPDFTPLGTGPAGTTLGPNLTYQGKSFDMGGCQGCHGNAQQGGADMSFLGAGGANSAEAIGEFENVSERVALYLGKLLRPSGTKKK